MEKFSIMQEHQTFGFIKNVMFLISSCDKRWLKVKDKSQNYSVLCWWWVISDCIRYFYYWWNSSIERTCLLELMILWKGSIERCCWMEMMWTSLVTIEILKLRPYLHELKLHYDNENLSKDLSMVWTVWYVTYIWKYKRIEIIASKVV